MTGEQDKPERSEPRATLSRQAFVDAYASMMTEAFEGPQGARSTFLDRGSGLLQTLDAVSATTASTAPRSGLNSIAAHAEHLRYSLASTRALLNGNTSPPDWHRSWQLQQVDDTQWSHLQSELRQEYEWLLDFAAAETDWNEVSVAGAIGLLAHATYHLGALRQIRRHLEHEPSTSSKT